MSKSPEQRAFDASRVVHKQLRGVTVMVKRGNDITLNVTATVGFTGDQDFSGEQAFALVTSFRDYIIDVADYKINDVVVEPAMGDKIIESVNGVSKIFSVTEDGSGYVADHDDTNETFWRIHTKEDYK